jgi:TrmH family RNA methyltransferase
MPAVISSLQNRRVKDAVRLRDRRGRERQGRFIIDGARELQRAIEGGVELDELFWCEALCIGGVARSVVEAARPGGTRLIAVTPEVFGKLAFGDRAEGVVGVARPALPTLEEVTAALPPRPLVAVLEGVEKPGNVGAVIRTADAAGVAAVVLADAGTDVFNPNAIRASQGALFSLPLAAVTSDETIAWLREQRIQVVAARVDGAVNYNAVDYTRPTAVVLGNEAAGLSDRWRGDAVTAAQVPMRGIVDSLNVSATAAVIFYEALRQRGARP